MISDLFEVYFFAPQENNAHAMAFRYFSSVYDDMVDASKGASYIFDDDANRETILGSGEGVDGEMCNCGCPASKTAAWVISLIEGLSVEDQKKTVKMVSKHFSPVMNTSAVNGNSVSGSAEPLFGDVNDIFSGKFDRDIKVDFSESESLSKDSIEGSAEDAEEQEVDFGTFDPASFNQVKISDIPRSREQFIEEEGEGIDIDLGVIDLGDTSFVVETEEISAELQSQLFELFS